METASSLSFIVQEQEHNKRVWLVATRIAWRKGNRKRAWRASHYYQNFLRAFQGRSQPGARGRIPRWKISPPPWRNQAI